MSIFCRRVFLHLQQNITIISSQEKYLGFVFDGDDSLTNDYKCMTKDGSTHTVFATMTPLPGEMVDTLVSIELYPDLIRVEIML